MKGAEDADAPSGQDLLEWMLNRYSVGPKHLRPPGPSDAQLVAAIRLALRAPDHHKLSPFRFVVVPDEMRAGLAGLFEDFARRCGADARAVRSEGARAYNGPTLVALVAQVVPDHPQVPEREQWICIGGALAGFVNALHLMGFASKVLSGRKAYDPRICSAFAREGETLVGWVVIGTPAKTPHPNCEDDVALVLRRWAGPDGETSQ